MKKTTFHMNYITMKMIYIASCANCIKPNHETLVTKFVKNNHHSELRGVFSTLDNFICLIPLSYYTLRHHDRLN